MISSVLLRTDSLQKTVTLQFVRYRRKPRWIPTAPSKLFRIPKKSQMESLEAVEWLRVNQNYKTQMNSLRRFLIKEVSDKQNSVAMDRPSAEDITNELEINRKWNDEIARIREKRVTQVRDERKQQIMGSLEKKKEKEENEAKRIWETVEKIDQQSKTFITRELLEQSIENCLANPKSYDYCIDSKGNVIDKNTK